MRLFSLLATAALALAAGSSPAATPVGTAAVSIRPGDHMLVVQGRPFFPLGTFEAPGTDASMQRLASAGFNLCPVPAGSVDRLSSVLDRLRAHGLYAWFSAGELLDLSADAEGRRRQLDVLVRAAGSHPGLLMWGGEDEPVWNHRNAAGFADGYHHLHAQDPGRPLWTCQAPRNTVDELGRWNRFTDIAAVDIYPVPEPQRQSSLPNRTIAVVGDECDKTRRTVGNAKPVFVVLQGFGWAELSVRAGQAARAEMPTLQQSRFMAYDAIVHGANGLLWWGTNRTRKPSRFWSDLRSLVSELGALQDVLAGETRHDASAATLLQPARGVRLVHKRAGDREVVILVNEGVGRTLAVVRWPGLGDGPVTRLFEGDAVPVRQHIARVPLSGYDVAVLGGSGSAASHRVDYSAEWRQPGAGVAPALAEPGNLVSNPGFEVDQDGDRVPDGWDASVPLAVTLSDDAHSGAHALALSGMGEGLTPLVVQRGTPILAGHRYRYSGWVKAPPGLQVRLYAEWVTGGVFHGQGIPWTRGTGAWTPVGCDVRGDPDPQGQAYVVVRVQGQGTALVDDLRLVEVK